ncbi:MAG: ferrous iron transporter B, partial [Clostridiales bacterium]|nr:ferrous iron transporter B [Clostridiales bacterium]
PGTYSLAPLGNEEKAACEYLESAGNDVDTHIICVIDATNIKKGLLLAAQIINAYDRVTVALNMFDEAKKEKLVIDVSALEKLFGVPFVPVSAVSGEGIPELLSAAGKIKENGGQKRHVPEEVNSIYLLADSVVSGGKADGFSDRIDRIICKSYIGIPLFFLVMAMIFLISFSAVGKLVSDKLSEAVSLIGERADAYLLACGCSKFVRGIVSDGVITGCGAVLSFLPQATVMYILLEALEDVGYLSRAAFATDSLMRKFGLSGKSFVPLLLGVGCAVPAVMSSRTLDGSEKKKILLSLPFVPCSARQPVVALLCASAFRNPAPAIFAFFIFGFAVALLSCALVKGEAASLVIELPKYRPPRLSNIAAVAKSKVFDFIARVGSIVVISSVITYVLGAITPRFSIAHGINDSLLAFLGEKAAFILKPIGLGDFRYAAALIAGVFAKESIISVLAVLGADSLAAPAAMALCAFSLLYIPCASTLTAIRKEAGLGTALLCAVRSFAVSYGVTFIVTTLMRMIFA